MACHLLGVSVRAPLLLHAHTKHKSNGTFLAFIHSLARPVYDLIGEKLFYKH